ncbi:MAG: Thiol-disulfide oxidoreductase ResA [Steroidobacteraceae bacterium]|nr:Thiol-disulfide oxidoreductase ResA [Steroidobacteraceae bacterium]
MNGMQRFLALAAILLLAGLAGFLGYRSLSSAAGPVASPAPVAASSTAAANGAEAGPTRPARVIPERLPGFTLKDRDGVPRTLAHWAGRPLLVNFWATWCAPCRREIPLLSSLRQQYAADGLEVIGIAVDFREDVLKYAQDIGLEYPLLIGEQDGLDAAAAFGVDPVFPFSIFSDRQGRIVTVRVGELHADEAAFILERVREVGANRLELPVAQQQIADKLRELAAKRAQTPS